MKKKRATSPKYFLFCFAYCSWRFWLSIVVSKRKHTVVVSNKSLFFALCLSIGSTASSVFCLGSVVGKLGKHAKEKWHAKNVFSYKVEGIKFKGCRCISCSVLRCPLFGICSYALWYRHKRWFRLCSSTP